MDYKKILLSGLILLLMTSGAYAAIYQSWDTNWQDHFTDGDYTNNPTWTVQAGTWAITTSLDLNGKTSDAAITTINTSNKNLSDTNVFFEYAINTDDGRSGGYWREFAITNTTNHSDANGYIYRCEKTTGCTFGKLTKGGTFTTLIGASGTFNNGTTYKIKIRRNTDGNWSIYKDNVFWGSVKDTNYVDANYIMLLSSNSGGAKYDDFNTGKIVWTDNSPSITPNFTVNIDKTNLKLDINDTSIPLNGVKINDWNWLVNDSPANIYTTNRDQNIRYTPINERTDYNICLRVSGTAGTTDVNNQLKCAITNSGKIYGDTNFWFFNELTGAPISTTIDFNGTEYTGTSFYLPTRQITNESATNATYTFIITKTGYGTRYYQVDLNKYADLNIGFAMLIDSNSANILLKVYQTDETTIFSNTYVQLYRPNNGLIVGRHKTNSAGETTFNLHISDQNYYANVNNGQYTYQPVTLTVLYPKNEQTLLQIDENWQLSITQNLYAQYSNLNASKIIYLLPNTALPFNIEVGDMNGNYFSRTYAKQYPGNPLSDTLQPYLVDITEGVLTTLRTVSGYTNIPVGTVQIKIYKLIPGLGRTYVEEVLTDSNGEALTMLITNDDYEFETYINNSYIATYDIKATSATIYIRVNDISWVKPVLGSDAFSITNTPTNGVLFSTDTNLIQNIYITKSGSSVSISSIHFYLINTDVNGTAGADVNLLHIVVPYTNQNFITNGFVVNSSLKTVNGVAYDNNGYFLIKIDIVTSDGNYSTTIMYKPVAGFEALYYVGPGARTFFGCSTGLDIFGYPIVCPTMLLMALFIALVITIGLAIEMGFTNMGALGAVFLLILGVFTYLSWVPIVLYALMIVMTAVVAFATRGRFT